MPAVAVQVHELGMPHVHPRAPQHAGLDGDVVVVLLLHAGRGLDLDQIPPPAALLEDVGHDQDAVVLERGLIEHPGARPHRLGGLPQPAVALPVGHVDQDPAGHIRVGPPADLVPHVEHELLSRVRLHLGSIRLGVRPSNHFVIDT